MKKSIIFGFVAVLFISAGFKAYAQNPEYVATPVTVSNEKVRGDDGQLYYSHIVLEKQTLFSIAKAYEVAVDDIYDANPGLKEEGLKALRNDNFAAGKLSDELLNSVNPGVLAELSCCTHCNFLLVKNMYMRLTIYTLHTSQTSYIFKFINIWWVYKVCWLVYFLSKSIDNLCSKNCRMLHKSSRCTIIKNLIIYWENSAWS